MYNVSDPGSRPGSTGQPSHEETRDHFETAQPTDPLHVSHRTQLSLPPVLTVPEAASFLRIGRSAAYELVRLGTIPSVRLGRSIRIPRDLLLNWLHNENAAGHEPAAADPWAVPLSTPLAPSARLREIPARPSRLPSNRPERRHER